MKNYIKKVKIDTKKIKKLALAGCNAKEIAAVIGYPIDILEREYSTYIENCNRKGEIIILQNLCESVIEGNKIVKRFLIKQYGDVDNGFNIISQRLKNYQINACKNQ